MRRQDVAALILAVVALVLAIAFAVVGTIPIWLGVILTVIVVVGTMLLFRQDLAAYFRRSSEERERADLRAAHGLRLVHGADETERAPRDVPDGVCGYEEIFAVAGLKNGEARLKPDRNPYPLEVHKFEGETYVVGYCSPTANNSLSSDAECRLTLWMRRQNPADVLVEVPISRVTGEQSLGTGTRRNAFRLDLTLAPARSNA